MAALFLSTEVVGEPSSGEDSAVYGDSSGSGHESQGHTQLSRHFEQAADHLQGMVHAASREQLLYLYARYKQVKVGKCNIPKPGFFDFEGKQKWEAWKALGDASPQQAMKEYVTTVRKLDPNWTPQTEASHIVHCILVEQKKIEDGISILFWSNSKKDSLRNRKGGRMPDGTQAYTEPKKSA